MVYGILSVVASVDSVVGSTVLSSEGVVSGVSSVVGTGVVSSEVS